MTHTLVELELSAATYDEIACKLRAAGYDHAFMKDIAGGTGAEMIDMHGIGITRGPQIRTDRSFSDMTDKSRVDRFGR